MTPVLTVPPENTLLTLDQIRSQLRIDGTHEDVFLADLLVEVVASLDGYHGALRRAILPQTWQVNYTGPGPYLLPLPDVTDVTVTIDTVAQDAADVVLTQEDGAVMLELANHGEHVVIDMVCALPAHRLPVARALAKVLIAHRYEHRGGILSGTSFAELPFAVQSLLKQLQWDGCILGHGPIGRPEQWGWA